MISKWQWLWRQLTHTLWIRASLFAVMGVVAALLALSAQLVFPDGFPYEVGAGAVDSVLNIIATSMLAVTTFSLSVMVTAYQAASTNVTPRATQLLIQDTTSQNVLGTFIGSFLYALVGIIALSTDAYGEAGRFFLFVVTIIVISLVVIALLRWISHLTSFGRVPDTCARVEAATREALMYRFESPCLGGIACSDDDLSVKFELAAERTGYLQHIDIPRLQEVAEEVGAVLRVRLLPGKFITIKDVLLVADCAISDAQEAKVAEAFLIDDTRSFDQDPRFGFIVLSEIASRALSPGINDPGTAIDVIGRGVRLFSLFANAPQAATAQCPRVQVPPLSNTDMLTDAFAPIVRDAANLVEVHIRLHKAIDQLEKVLGAEWHTPLQRLRDYASVYAKQELNGEDQKRLQRMA
ncbi:DUF2254 domain-containing protein [Aliidiomarina sp. Khilg15.8]